MKIIIPGIPVAQTRMRYSGRNGIGRLYDPREKEKKAIKKIISDKYTNLRLPRLIHPRVSFIYHMPIPKSVPKSELPLYMSGLLKHEKKPDTDNLIKLYLDCLDDIAFDGDQKVMLGPSIKLYHPHPKTIIIMNETVETLSPLEVDPMTWYTLFGEECGKCSYAEINSLRDFYTPTHLESERSHDTIFPRQTIPTYEQPPTVRGILEASQYHYLLNKTHKVNAC
jgi:Holliday junction resolvase RusA-like endonuclease